ncbi:hypothetical protein DNAM5_187 [Bacillus phage Vinny]|uniref:Uncharacterized protein n=1 Tax=Bacillus phage Vinny TaxID=1805955 RepID=A0A143FJM8_9CAUD|nr:hypothetical protein DNAM5_187 [Bacillus phage Vinny]
MTKGNHAMPNKGGKGMKRNQLTDSKLTGQAANATLQGANSSLILLHNKNKQKLGGNIIYEFC